MSEQNYNSLADRLKQNGILFSDDNKISEENKEYENIFFKNSNLETKNNDKNQVKKRINQYDLDLIKKVTNPNESANRMTIIDFFKYIVNSKEEKIDNKNFFKLFLLKIFPKLYKAKLIKQAIVKLKKLNIDTNELLDKTIPYGENKIRYENLVKYLNVASEIQSDLKNNS